MSQLDLFAAVLATTPDTRRLHALYVDCFGAKPPSEMHWPRGHQQALNEILATIPTTPALEERLRPLHRFIQDALREREHAELALASAVRHLTALLGDPVGAPDYPGTWWTSRHMWTGPFHLVPVALVPYPGNLCPIPLPDIESPAAKALCGFPYSGQPHRWPHAHEVCPECAAMAGAH